MDEINEKAINDIIAYYDSLEETDDTTDETPSAEEAPQNAPEEEAPNLVELVEEAQKKEEETPKAEEPKVETVGLEEAEPEVQPEAEDDTDEEADEENYIPTITPVYDLSKPEEEEKAKVSANKLTKKQRLAIIIPTVLLAVIVALFVTVDTGFIGNYKKNFARNASVITSWIGLDANGGDTKASNANNVTNYRNSAKSAVTIPMENAGKSVFADYNNGVVCAYTNYLSFISSDGTIAWENTTTIVDPILRTAGNYILIAEKGGKKICLYNDSKLFFETDTEDNILTCSVSSNGDIVVVTDKEAYKGAVAVFNREGNKVFAWASGSDNIISADISSESRRVAVALLNTDNKVKSTIQLFDMNETESYAQAVFEDTILFDIDFIGDMVSAFGDNCIAGFSAGGELIYDKRFDSAEFVHYGMDASGNKILLFDDTNIPLINIYNAKAILKYQLTSDELPDFVDIRGRYVVFNNGRNVIYGKAGKKQLGKYTASMDIKDLLIIDEDTFVIVYSNNIEVVRM